VNFANISILDWSQSLLYCFIYDNLNVNILAYQLLSNASFKLEHYFEWICQPNSIYFFLYHMWL